MSDWIEHDGGPCPVAGGAKVQVRMRDGATERVQLASYWNATDDGRDYWAHDHEDHNSDIIAYRIVSPQTEGAVL